MKISAKQGAITFIAILLIGTLGVLYTASRVIIFTNHFSTYIEVSRTEREVSVNDIYITLNRMEEVRTHPGDCPNRLGDCWSVGGNITLPGDPSSHGPIRFRISTGETTGVWSPTSSPARHDAFVESVIKAFQDEGYVVGKPEN